MEKLIELSNKDVKYVVGLMSGTSLDGVDVALVEIKNNWIDTRINLIGFIEFPFPTGLKSIILRNSQKETSNVEDISQLNFLIPQIYYEAIETPTFSFIVSCSVEQTMGFKSFISTC